MTLYISLIKQVLGVTENGSIEERNKIFYAGIQQAQWIIEDTGIPCFEKGLMDADKIVLLDIPKKISIIEL